MTQASTGNDTTFLTHAWTFSARQLAVVSTQTASPSGKPTTCTFGSPNLTPAANAALPPKDAGLLPETGSKTSIMLD
jgi:hypothetical protein